MTEGDVSAGQSPVPYTKITMDVLTQNNINVLPWPSKSPDLNPIKHLWDELDRRVRQRQPQSLDQLSQALNGK